jgi:hypothetical protein
MPTVLRNAVALVAGIVIGSVVNMALISLSPSLVPPPPGVDVHDPESLKQSIHLFSPRHFVMPFLAHAVGTLAGALAAFLIAASHQRAFAYAVGVLFLCGGIAASFMIPAPRWFIVLDVLAAYLPMAWLATQMAPRIKDRWAARKGGA